MSRNTPRINGRGNEYEIHQRLCRIQKGTEIATIDTIERLEQLLRDFQTGREEMRERQKGMFACRRTDRINRGYGIWVTLPVRIDGLNNHYQKLIKELGPCPDYETKRHRWQQASDCFQEQLNRAVAGQMWLFRIPQSRKKQKRIETLTKLTLQQLEFGGIGGDELINYASQVGGIFRSNLVELRNAKKCVQLRPTSDNRIFLMKLGSAMEDDMLQSIYKETSDIIVARDMYMMEHGKAFDLLKVTEYEVNCYAYNTALKEYQSTISDDCTYPDCRECDDAVALPIRVSTGQLKSDPGCENCVSLYRKWSRVGIMIEREGKYYIDLSKWKSFTKARKISCSNCDLNLIAIMFLMDTAGHLELKEKVHINFLKQLLNQNFYCTYLASHPNGPAEPLFEMVLHLIVLTVPSGRKLLVRELATRVCHWFWFWQGYFVPAMKAIHAYKLVKPEYLKFNYTVSPIPGPKSYITTPENNQQATPIPTDERPKASNHKKTKDTPENDQQATPIPTDERPKASNHKKTKDKPKQIKVLHKNHATEVAQVRPKRETNVVPCPPQKPYSKELRTQTSHDGLTTQKLEKPSKPNASSSHDGLTTQKVEKQSNPPAASSSHDDLSTQKVEKPIVPNGSNLNTREGKKSSLRSCTSQEPMSDIRLAAEPWLNATVETDADEMVRIFIARFVLLLMENRSTQAREDYVKMLEQPTGLKENMLSISAQGGTPELYMFIEEGTNRLFSKHEPQYLESLMIEIENRVIKAIDDLMVALRCDHDTIETDASMQMETSASKPSADVICDFSSSASKPIRDLSSSQSDLETLKLKSIKVASVVSLSQE